MTITDRIKLKAEEKGISIKALEKEVGLGNGTIKRWEVSSPQCNKIMLVAEYLNTPLDWLITGKLNNISLSKVETKLIELYQIADERGKEAIFETAKREAERNYKGKSSNSKIG